MAERYVITLSRQFASMGRSIAKELSQELDIEFYDRDLVEAAANRMNLPISTISDTEEQAKNSYFRRIYPLGNGISSVKDELFMTQRNIIRDLAGKESCIIVGRCGDVVLSDFDRVLNVRIFAPYRDRLRNCVERLGMDEKTARKMIDRVDASREIYHRVYGGCDTLDHCDVMLNSSRFGVEGTAKLLAVIARDRFGL